MLRTVRSLPSLRLLFQQETTASIKKKSFINSKSTYSYVSGDLIQPSVVSSTSIRNVHQTTKKETILLESSSNKSKYTSMNLQGLKMECKIRGLKVSGKKIELIQRLVSQDQIGHDSSARSFSSLNSKNDFNHSNPKFALLDQEIKDSKIARALKQNKANSTKSSKDIIVQSKGKKDSRKLKLEEDRALAEIRAAQLKEKAKTRQHLSEERRISLEVSENLKFQDQRRAAQAKAAELKKIQEQNKVEEQKQLIEKQKIEKDLAEKKRQDDHILKLKEESKRLEMLEVQRKEEERTRIQERKAAELKFQAEKKMEEEAEKVRQLQLAKQKEIAEIKLKEKKKLEELELQRKKTAESFAEKKKLKENVKSDITEVKTEQFQDKEELSKLTKNIAEKISKQSLVSKVLSKTQNQSKAEVIANAKRHLQERVKKQQNEQQEGNKQNTQNEFTSRDIKFLTAFGATTIGWWSFKNADA